MEDTSLNMDVTLPIGCRRLADAFFARFLLVVTLVLDCISFHKAGVVSKRKNVSSLDVLYRQRKVVKMPLGNIGFLLESVSMLSENVVSSQGAGEESYVPKGKGGEFCEGYTDDVGVYHNGFQCPLSWEDGSETEEVYCCGTATNRYCCDEPTSNFNSAHIGAIIGGVFALIILIITCVCLCCCFCSCCFCNRKRRLPRRRGHRPFPTLQPTTTTSVPTPTHIPMTVLNGQSNGKYPKQQIRVPPPVPSQPPLHINPPAPPAAAAAAAPYSSPTHGYTPQPAYAPQPLPHQMPPHEMPPQYNPHAPPSMDYRPQHYSPQHYSPQQQYPPQPFGVPPPQPPPYSPEVEAPPLLDKGMAYPPAATSGPCAPPSADPGYPQKH